MKKTILTVIQVLVTVGILFWVFHDPHKRAEMGEALSHAGSHPGWLLAGFGCYGVVEFLAAFRWYILLRVQGVHLPAWRVGALLMLGIFFNMFMPGGTGGDVLKIFYLIKEIPKKKAAGLLAVLMDRLIGLLALIMISTVIIGIQYSWLKTNPVSRNLTWILLLILLSGLSGIVFSFLISGFGLANKLPAKMPMRDKLIDLAVAYNAYARSWPASLVALVSSFGVHMASFSLFVCAARALDVHVSTGLCGISQAEAVTLSLTGFMLSAAWGAIGGGIYLLYRPSDQGPSDHAKLSEVARQVHELEHEVAESEEPEHDNAEK
jgi:uncharacterized protein (TIRG00374 family)